MANLVHSAKSASYWTLNDLASYHISLNQVDPLLFFGLQELPQPMVDEELLNITDAGLMQQGCNIQLIYMLDHVMDSGGHRETAIDFAVLLFNVLGYTHRNQVARTRVDLPLLICGEARHARADVCIVNCLQHDILLVVQEDKRLEHGEPVSAQVQLVAEAVAAFNKNNAQRKAVGLPSITKKIMPGIVMVGTLPIFFKIPITQTLSTHIHHGTYPPEETHVTYCYPSMPRPAQQYYEGMKPLDNRREILKCYEAFKSIVGV